MRIGYVLVNEQVYEEGPAFVTARFNPATGQSSYDLTANGRYAYVYPSREAAESTAAFLGTDGVGVPVHPVPLSDYALSI